VPRSTHPLTALALVAAVAATAAAQQPAAPVPPAYHVGQRWADSAGGVRFVAEVVAVGLQVPSAIAFLPDGRALVAERPSGRLSLLDVATGARTPVEGVPAVHGQVDGGLLDVALHPDHARNRLVYLAYAEATPAENTTVVDRARLDGTRLVERRRLFTARPHLDGSNHFGARLALRDGWLFVAVGDRHARELAQNLTTHMGKIVRLRDDGAVPRDNPFVGRAGALPEIWSYGHRNPQGLAFEPGTGALWEHEHGPRGGDEVNVVRRGANYGWPLVSFGAEYEGGAIGDGRPERAGVEPPVHHWTPSIAPSGMTFYRGAGFPAWRGSLFVGAMALRHLNRLVLDGRRVVREERLLAERRWRVRAVAEGPDGLLYLGVDDGLVVRLRPDGGPAPARGER
jgi:aldose sugar dehydrogenase